MRLIAIIAFCVSGLEVMAGGFRLPDQDAFATARGEAFVATADNASAIYYNPAGLSQLDGHNIRVGSYGIFYDPTYTRPAPANTNTFNNKERAGAAPQIFYSYTLKESPVSFGLGAYCPYGLSLHWPQDVGFRTVGMKSSLTYLRISPVVALELAPNLSIGAGLLIDRAAIELNQGLYPVQTGNDGFGFEGDGWGCGYNLGVLWQVHEKISFGASFRSTTAFTLEGSTRVELPPFVPATSQSASADFKFPWTAVVGLSYRPTPKWNLEFNADYTDWSTFGTVTIEQEAAIFPLPQNPSLILNWQSSWLYEFGATRYLDDHWNLSAGYVFSENSVPNAHYTPLVADLDRHFFSIGGGFKGETFNFDVVYQFGYGSAHKVAGSAISIVGQTADGKYDWISHALLLTVGLHF